MDCPDIHRLIASSNVLSIRDIVNFGQANKAIRQSVYTNGKFWDGVAAKRLTKDKTRLLDMVPTEETSEESSDEASAETLMRSDIKKILYRLEKETDIGKKLDFAAEFGYELAIEKLLNNKTTQCNMNSAALSAAKAGYLDIVKFVVKKGADIDSIRDTAVEWSAAEGHLDVVKYFVEKGANINYQDGYALRWAAANNHLDIVEYLMTNGAGRGLSCAIDWAIESGHLKIIKYFRDTVGGIPNIHQYMMTCARRHDSVLIVKYLEDCGVADEIRENDK